MNRRTYRQEGGRSGHPLKTVGYQLRPGGPLVTLIDGKTGGPVAFKNEDIYLAAFGGDNEAARVLKAMETFDALRVVGR